MIKGEAGSSAIITVVIIVLAMVAAILFSLQLSASNTIRAERCQQLADMAGRSDLTPTQSQLIIEEYDTMGCDDDMIDFGLDAE